MCPHCHQPLTKENDRTLLCPGCGTPVGPDDSFCQKCGHPIYENLKKSGHTRQRPAEQAETSPSADEVSSPAADSVVETVPADALNNPSSVQQEPADLPHSASAGNSSPQTQNKKTVTDSSAVSSFASNDRHPASLSFKKLRPWMYAAAAIAILGIGIVLWMLFGPGKSQNGYAPGNYVSLRESPVYSSADTSELIAAVDIGQTVDISEMQTLHDTVWGRTEKGWVQIRDADVCYFVPLSMTSIDTQTDGSVYEVEIDTQTYTFPGTQYPKVELIDSGTRLEIEETWKDQNQNLWGLYRFNGWIPIELNHQVFLKKTDDTSSSAENQDAFSQDSADSSSTTDESSPSSSADEDQPDTPEDAGTDDSSSTGYTPAGDENDTSGPGKAMEPGFTVHTAEQPSYTAPAVAQSILHRRGIEMSQQDIAELMQTDTEFGTYPVDAAAVLSNYTDKTWISDQIESSGMTSDEIDTFLGLIKSNIDNGYPLVAVIPAGSMDTDETDYPEYILISGYKCDSSGNISQIGCQNPAASDPVLQYIKTSQLIEMMKSQNYFSYIR